MILEAITIGVIGVTYVTGDAKRKQKMRKAGSELFDVAKTTVQDTITFTKNTIEKIKMKQESKKNNS